MPAIRLDPVVLDDLLAPVDAALARDYPGPRAGVQPVHTVYVPAPDASPDVVAQWGMQALQLLDSHPVPDPDGVLERVRQVLRTGAVQDLRLDFEDGYGWRGEATEDADAIRAGQTLAALPAGLGTRGVRCKGLEPHERRRGLRTLELVLDGAGGVPDGFVFTVPKLRHAGQVDAVVALCTELERAHGLPSGALHFELQVETPQAVLGADGTATVATALHRSHGRCTGLHYGTYDYSAACGIAAAHQSLEHPVADHAKDVMLVAAAGTGVWVCDGSTNVVPIGTRQQVQAAWGLHRRLVTRSLRRGFAQGWDLHPGQLVTRWLAVFGFYRAALEPTAARLRAYLDNIGGAVLDEPATAQALAAVLVRGVDVGAVDERELLAATGVDRGVLQSLVTRTARSGA